MHCSKNVLNLIPCAALLVCVVPQSPQRVVVVPADQGYGDRGYNEIPVSEGEREIVHCESVMMSQGQMN